MHRWRGTLLVLACWAIPGPASPAQDPGQPPPQATRFDIELPASLEARRETYRQEIGTALDQVVKWFASAGFSVTPTDLLQKAVVFHDMAAARQGLARAFGAEAEHIPETFSGTVNGTTLYVVARETYRPIWEKLYPQWPWGAETYRGLIVHEIAHRAHEVIITTRFGTEDAMGPDWFFEGLAMTCANQFPLDPEGQAAFTWAELRAQVGSGQQPKVSYPLYSRLVGSLARLVSVKTLIERAREPGFPMTLEQPKAPPSP